MNYFRKNGFGAFIAIELKTGNFVGRCGFKELANGEIEVGYVFLKEYWGKGLATEALIGLLNWAKENVFKVDQIIAFTPIEHVASQRVMQKAGMIYLKEDVQDGQHCVFYVIKLR